MEYSVYWPDTGEVICQGTCSVPEDIALQVDAWEGHYLIAQAVDGLTHYIVAGEPVPRPLLEEIPDVATIAADGVEQLSYPLPAGSDVTFLGQRAPVDNGVQFRTNVPGEYEIKIEPPFPYIGKSIRITAE